MLSIEQIQADILKMSQKIMAPKEHLPTFDFPIGDATPFIEINGGQYHYVISERGHEYERKSTTDIQELYYYVFRELTFTMAIMYEAMHRIENQDSRQLFFQKQESLMEEIHPEWKKRIRSERNETLKDNPFIDE